MALQRQDCGAAAPLVVHLVYRLDFGGLETLLVDCINRMPAERYRHAVVCLTGYTAFAERITRPGVELYALDKAPGLGLSTHARLFKLLRKLRPTILHTYNFACAEYAVTAALAGVPVRIHAEHGRDAGDPHGLNRKHNFLRRAVAPWIDRIIPVSADLQRWLGAVVGIAPAKTELIVNGVDTENYAPCIEAAALPWPASPERFVIGTVGRVQDVKDQATLVDAFALLRARYPERDLRLVIVGDGPLRAALEQRIEAAGLSGCAWMSGARSDIAALMRSFSVFTLSSLAEGTPVTLLEAMACGLPAVATSVGGIPEVLQDGVAGRLVAPGDAAALAAALAGYLDDPTLAARHGAQARARAERQYSIAAMIGAYTALYDRISKSKTNFKENTEPCAE